MRYLLQSLKKMTCGLLLLPTLLLSNCFLFTTQSADHSDKDHSDNVSLAKSIILTYASSGALRSEAFSQIQTIWTQRLKFYQAIYPKVFQSFVIKHHQNTANIRFYGVSEFNQEVKELLSSQGKLSFKIFDPIHQKWLPIGLDNSAIETIHSAPSMGGSWSIALSFTSSARARVEVITTQYLNKKLGIFIDDNLISEPIIRSPIREGKTMIDGLSRSVAIHSTALVKFGKLPNTLQLTQEH